MILLKIKNIKILMIINLYLFQNKNLLPLLKYFYIIIFIYLLFNLLFFIIKLKIIYLLKKKINIKIRIHHHLRREKS